MNLTPSGGRWGIMTDRTCGHHVVQYKWSEMLSEFFRGDIILGSWWNGWPNMGCRNSGSLLNIQYMYKYEIPFFKERLTGTYSKLFGNNRSCPVNAVNNDPGVGHLPIQRDLHVGHLNSFLELGEGNLTAKNWKFQMLGGLPRGWYWCYKLIGA